MWSRILAWRLRTRDVVPPTIQTTFAAESQERPCQLLFIPQNGYATWTDEWGGVEGGGKPGKKLLHRHGGSNRSSTKMLTHLRLEMT